MSYRPRPPMGMPPGLMPQGYGYAPMGMMSMGMRMMPMMQQPSSQMGMGNSNNSQKTYKKLIPQEIPKLEKKEERPPVTTVFVGNISERAPDSMIRQMLQRCGNVLSWKRVQGASGKLQAFGFCEYEEPEATLRCIRLLNEWDIANKKLVVKVDAKTKTLLDEYKKKKVAEGSGDDAAAAKKKSGSESEDDDGEDAKTANGEDEASQREDRVAQAGLDAIMREYSRDLAKEPATPGQHMGRRDDDREHREHRRRKREKEEIESKDAGLDDMELEEEQKDLINREIRSFRDAHKRDDSSDREKEGEVRRRREEERERERERERGEREREERYLRGERERKEREKPAPPPPPQVKERSPRSESRERSWSRERERTAEDEEEIYEKRKIERKIREKEATYQELLKKWETRERKKMRDYDKERDREEERKSEENQEGRRLKEFLEDYDDERDDPKYYKGSALQRRLKEREKEMEGDERDRQREKDEIAEIRRKLLQQGHPDPDAEMARIEQERDEHLMPRLKASRSADPRAAATRPAHDDEVVEIADEEEEEEEEQEPTPSPSPSPIAIIAPPAEPAVVAVPAPVLPPADASPGVSSGGSSAASDFSDDGAPLSDSEPSQSAVFIGPSTERDQLAARLGFDSMKRGDTQSSSSPASQATPSADPTPLSAAAATASEDEGKQTTAKRRKLTVGDVFNQDEELSGRSRRRKLVPLDYADRRQLPAHADATAMATAAAAALRAKPPTAEEKRKSIKNLIERIPTGKDELFDYELDWVMVDSTLMERRIKPWVNRKIVEYIGEEEPTLTDFICQKVMAHSTPQHILNDVAMVLDEEAEVFVVKMWRLLIYETEAKKLGLVK